MGPGRKGRRKGGKGKGSLKTPSNTILLKGGGGKKGNLKKGDKEKGNCFFQSLSTKKRGKGGESHLWGRRRKKGREKKKKKGKRDSIFHHLFYFVFSKKKGKERLWG